jgi:hypothetical protein
MCGDNYILQDGNHIGTDIYKIGRTDRTMEERLGGYSEGTIVLCRWNTGNLSRFIENEIKKIFKEKYKLVSGSEWFSGDKESMKDDIQNIIDNEFKKNSLTFLSSNRFDIVLRKNEHLEIYFNFLIQLSIEEKITAYELKKKFISWCEEKSLEPRNIHHALSYIGKINNDNNGKYYIKTEKFIWNPESYKKKGYCKIF